MYSSLHPHQPGFTQAHVQSLGHAAEYAGRVKDRHVALTNPPRKAKEKKEKPPAKQRLWRLDIATAKWDLFVPLHRLWMAYMSELLALNGSLPNSATMHPKLVKADYVGALLTVSQSKNPALVGKQGIVIFESENTFQLVTRDDKVKMIPKQNSIFTLAIPLNSSLPANYTPSTPLPIPQPSDPPPTTTVLDEPHFTLQLYGNQFRFRASDRAGRKFKHKETIEL